MMPSTDLNRPRMVAPREDHMIQGLIVGEAAAEPTPSHANRRLVVTRKQSASNQRCTHGLAVDAHPATDRPHRDARSREAHSLGLLVDPQPRPSARHIAATQMGEHRGAVDAVPLSECLDAHPGEVVADERVHLGGGEKSLSRLDSPHNGATIVLRSGILGASRDLVDPTV